MIHATSAAVNEAIAVLREQIEDVRKDLQTADMTEKAMLRAQLNEMTDRLATIENNRANVLVSFIAGRRGLDKLPAAEIEVVVRAIADFAPAVEEKKE